VLISNHCADWISLRYPRSLGRYLDRRQVRGTTRARYDSMHKHTSCRISSGTQPRVSFTRWQVIWNLPGATGHSTISTTADIYTHLLDEAKAGAATKLLASEFIQW